MYIKDILHWHINGISKDYFGSLILKFMIRVHAELLITNSIQLHNLIMTVMMII